MINNLQNSTRTNYLLLISTCSEKLSEEEFVKPVAKIINQKYEIKHYTEKIDFGKYFKIIICGTAIKDNEYLSNIARFDWIRTFQRPILGICSGMQVIAKIHNASIVKSKEIGIERVHTLKNNMLFSGEFDAYFLHQNTVSGTVEFDVLAKTETGIAAVKHKSLEQYGVMFHPEVRCQEIVRHFARQ